IFCRTANIDELHVASLLDQIIDILDRYLFDLVFLTRERSANDEPSNSFMSDASEPRNGFIDLLRRLTYQGDRSSNWNQCSSPGSKLAAKPNVDRVWDVTGSVFEIFPNVDHHAFERSDLVGGKLSWFFDLGKSCRTFQIFCSTLWKIGGNFRLAAGDK